MTSGVRTIPSKERNRWASRVGAELDVLHNIYHKVSEKEWVESSTGPNMQAA
jgi:hypothetical protein